MEGRRREETKKFVVILIINTWDLYCAVSKISSLVEGKRC
jgi:hypothetical protein